MDPRQFCLWDFGLDWDYFGSRERMGSISHSMRKGFMKFKSGSNTFGKFKTHDEQNFEQQKQNVCGEASEFIIMSFTI